VTAAVSLCACAQASRATMATIALYVDRRTILSAAIGCWSADSRGPDSERELTMLALGALTGVWIVGKM
jgi:hypothetical protein